MVESRNIRYRQALALRLSEQYLSDADVDGFVKRYEYILQLFNNEFDGLFIYNSHDKHIQINLIYFLGDFLNIWSK